MDTADTLRIGINKKLLDSYMILYYNYPIKGKEDSNENRKQISI